MKRLSKDNIADRPMYPPKVLQFGGGNFLRAFVDWMIEELNEKTDFGGSVVVVKPTERGDYDALRAQDGLFHVLTRGIKNGNLVDTHQLISCIHQVVHPYREWDTYLKTAELESIQFIVSNTTEAGIQFSATDRMEDTPAQEFPAKLTQWLYHRFQHFEGASDKGCIFLPCELIEDNAIALRDSILQYAAHWQLDSAFADWIRNNNHFCNTLVDRIVPGYPKNDISAIQAAIGYEDQLLVAAEPYHIWAIEAEEHIQQALPFAETALNVVFTNDLSPYRELKVRILNGAHTVMVPIGYLAGIASVREAVADEKVGKIIQDIIYDEILPTLDYPKETLEQYAKDVLDRFKNPFIHHLLISISLNAIPKFKARLLPTLQAYVARFGHAPKGIGKALAHLIYFYKGEYRGKEIPLKASDTVLDFFQNLWTSTTPDLAHIVKKTLVHQDFWGTNLNELADLPAVVLEELEQIA
ncbi:MAG: tagaturonate reductase [Bacteroidota bacterium]